MTAANRAIGGGRKFLVASRQDSQVYDGPGYPLYMRAYDDMRRQLMNLTAASWIPAQRAVHLDLYVTQTDWNR